MIKQEYREALDSCSKRMMELNNEISKEKGLIEGLNEQYIGSASFKKYEKVTYKNGSHYFILDVYTDSNLDYYYSLTDYKDFDKPRSPEAGFIICNVSVSYCRDEELKHGWV